MIKSVNGRGQLHKIGAPAVVSDEGVQYWQNGRLHREDGPAVMTNRGTRQYYWKGVRIDKQLWDSRAKLSLQEILNHPNAEIRRCLVEMRGWKNLVAEAKPTIVHADPKRNMTLYRIELPPPADEPILVLSVLDGTATAEGRKQYFLRVPPNMTECLIAAAWTFRMLPDEYKELERET